MPNTGPEVQVACALIWRDGQILLSKRHQGAHQGGLWEFPGGKFELGEDPKSCLNRELEEELGISLCGSFFMFQIPWDYGDKSIRLWVYEVIEFDGEPQGLEGQDVNWFSSDALKALEFPKANDAIVRAIGLPRIIRIYDPTLTLEPAIWATQTEHQCLLYFRGLMPGIELETVIDAALTRGHQVILTLDQLPCFRAGCGVHLRKTDCVSDALTHLEKLNDPWPITAGIRDEQDLERQRAWPFDALLISPVRETPSHHGTQALGWDRFSELASMVGVPAYALGGMNHDDLPTVIEYGGFGVAGIRGL
jgi:8-oxo-dGTP diphosphatase